MPLHVGIVGCSPEGAALCYRTLCAESAKRLGAYQHPEITLHSQPLAAYVRCLDRDDLAGVAELMLTSARKLAAAGADFLICPDNTIHRALPLLEARSPLPWLHIAEVVAMEASARGFRRVGLLGTRWLVDSEVYPEKLSALDVRCVKPGARERDEVARIIMQELVHGAASPASVEYLLGVIRGFRDQGCDAVVLGCTELPLVLDDTHSVLPTLDSTRLLALAALRRAVSADEAS